MRYRVTHVTTYSGDEPVSVGHNEARLRPRQLPYQECRRHELRITPSPSSRTEHADYFGNAVAAFSFNQGYARLTVTAVSDVAVAPRLPPATMADSPTWTAVRDRLWRPRSTLDLHALEFAFDSSQALTSPELADYARESFPAGRPLLEAVRELTARIYRDFQYTPKSTHIATRVQETLQTRRGVCQDFAHLEIAALRSLGLAARYVSGYMRTYPPPGKPRLIGADASHAWLSVYCGDLGWIDLDPTNNVFANQEHITLAWGRDFLDISPLKGVYIGGGSHHLTVSVDVEPQVDVVT